MKIAICSDVHLEFGQLELENTHNAEVLVLSGDICTACDLRVTDSILSSAKTDRYLDFLLLAVGTFLMWFMLWGITSIIMVTTLLLQAF
jgi:predicted phosphodiesterase